jgi:hypothetical protein
MPANPSLQLGYCYREMRGENTASVRHYSPGPPVKPHDVVHEQLTKALRIQSLLAWHKMHHLCHTVHEHDHRIVSLDGTRQFRDHVHRDVEPLALCDWQGLQSTLWCTIVGFDALARVALRYVLLYVLCHVRPVEQLANQSFRLGSPEMSGEYRVMTRFHDLVPHVTRWDDQSTFRVPPQVVVILRPLVLVICSFRSEPIVVRQLTQKKKKKERVPLGAYI